MTITFSGLVRQYDESSQAGKVFLALTPSGPQFVVKGFFHRLFDRIFRGFSYDLCESADNLRKRALKVISQMDAFEASAKKVTDSPLTTRKTRRDLKDYSKKTLGAQEIELLAAFKIIKIANNLLQHSLEKTPEGSRKGCLFLKTTTQRENSLASLSAITKDIAERVGKRQGLNKLEILIENKCYPEMIETIVSQGVSPGINHEKLATALQVCCDHKQVLAAVTLLRNKISSKNLRNIEPEILAEMARELLKASQGCDDETLSHLIDDHESLSNNTELFLEAISQQFPLSVKKFAEKNPTLLHHVDEEKNTILHTAFLTGNVPICRFLIQHLDPLKRNMFNQTPLQAMLEPKEKLASQRPQQAVNVKSFIEKISVREEGAPPLFLYKELSYLTQGKIPDETQIDLLELFFLLGEPLSEIPSSLTRAHFEATISYLKKRYPQASLDEFFLSFFYVNKEYLKTGCETFNLPKDSPKNISLNSLYGLFDSISWNPKEVAGLYARVFGDAKCSDNLIMELRARIEKLLDDIEYKKVTPDLPSEGKPLFEFYSHIEVCLKNAISTLIKKNDKARTLAFIKGLLIASKHCGERYRLAITNLYRQIRKQDDSSRSEFLGQLLLGYRRSCLEKVIRELYPNHSGLAEQVIRDHSKELGLVAPKAAPDHSPASADYNWPRIEKSFFEKTYSSHAIVYEFLLPLLSQDDEVQQMYIALQGDFIPPTWNDEKYGPIREELRKIRKIKSPGTYLKKSILSKYNITLKDGERAKTAVERERKAEYMKTMVRDSSGAWNVSGLILLLEQIGILSCRMEKALPPKQISFMPRSMSLLEIFKV